MIAIDKDQKASINALKDGALKDGGADLKNTSLKNAMEQNDHTSRTVSTYSNLIIETDLWQSLNLHSCLIASQRQLQCLNLVTQM